jgi:hypothetical protein
VLEYTVKAGTLMQLAAPLAQLRAKHRVYVADAFDPDVTESDCVLAAGAFAAVLSRLWNLKWENRHKEALWRVAADACWAFPMRARERAGGIVHVCQACGADMTFGDRRHYFWDCVVARGLRESMGMAVGALPEDSLGVFARADLWLVRPPPGLAPPVWDVVCLAALSAMDMGRQRIVMAGRGLPAEAPLPSHRVLAIGLEVVADFWGRLQAFASLGVRPSGWDAVPSGHVFLSRGVGGRIDVVLPYDAASPPPSP